MGDYYQEDPSGAAGNPAKRGINAISCFTGGLLLIAVQILSARWKFLALIIGVILCVIGCGKLFSKNPQSKRTAVFLTIMGALILLSRIRIPAIAAAMMTLLIILAFVLLGLGIVNAVFYFIDLGRRDKGGFV